MIFWAIAMPKAPRVFQIQGARCDSSGAEGQVPDRMPTGISSPVALTRNRRCLSCWVAGLLGWGWIDQMEITTSNSHENLFFNQWSPSQCHWIAGKIMKISTGNHVFSHEISVFPEDFQPVQWQWRLTHVDTTSGAAEVWSPSADRSYHWEVFVQRPAPRHTAKSWPSTWRSARVWFGKPMAFGER